MSDPVKFQFESESGFRNAIILGPVIVSEKLRYLLAPDLFGFSPDERMITSHILIRRLFFRIFLLLLKKDREEQSCSECSAFSEYFANDIKNKNISRPYHIYIQKIIMSNIKYQKLSEIPADELIRLTDCNSKLADFLHFLKEGKRAVTPHRKDYGYILERILDHWWNLGFHSQIMKSYVDHNNLYFINNCRRFCCTLLAIHKKQDSKSILHRLPKNVVVYLAKLIWTTKFDIITWI